MHRSLAFYKKTSGIGLSIGLLGVKCNLREGRLPIGRRIPSFFYEKAVLCQAENSSFLTSRNSVPGIPPISVCLGLAGGVVKGAPVLGGEANP